MLQMYRYTTRALAAGAEGHIYARTQRLGHADAYKEFAESSQRNEVGPYPDSRSK